MFKYSLSATQSKAWAERDKPLQIATGSKSMRGLHKNTDKNTERPGEIPGRPE